MRRVALLFAAVVITVRPSAADACTCGRVPMERTTVPGSGTRGFPTDGRIRVFLTGGFPAALRARMAQQYRLRGPDGTTVAMDGKVEDLMLSLRPRAPLAPRTQYVLERVYAYTPAGDLLSDSQRWERTLYSPGEPVELYWYPDSWFVTGDGPEERTPVAPELIEARAHVNGFGSSCGPGTELTVSFGPVRGMGPSDVLALERKGAGIVRTFGLRGLQPDEHGVVSWSVGDTVCNPDPLSPDVNRDSEVRLIAISPDDDQAPAPHFQPVAGKLESDPPAGQKGKKVIVLGTIGVRQPDEGEAAAVERWFQGKPGEARAAVPGPTACPFGLERGGTAGDAPARAAASSGIVITGPRKDAVRVTARSAAARGRKEPAEAWIRELSFEGKTLSNPLLAVGPRHALACWNESAERETARLVCTILDSATGRVEKAPAPLELPESRLAVPALRDGAAIALPTSFMIGWTGSAGPGGEVASHLTLMAENGNPPVSDRTFSGTGDVDLARAGMRVALARETGTGIDLDVIDATTSEGGATTRVSIGSGPTSRRPRRPRVALRGELAVLVWQNESEDRLLITVADGGGHVAQPLPLGRGKIETLRAEGKNGALGVTASWGESERPLESARLQCRRRAAFTAPWRIDTNAEGTSRREREPPAPRPGADGNRSPSGGEMLDSPR